MNCNQPSSAVKSKTCMYETVIVNYSVTTILLADSYAHMTVTYNFN